MGGSDVIRSRKAIVGAGLLAMFALFAAMMFAVTMQAHAGKPITVGMVQDVDDQKYTGSKIEPTVTVMDGSEKLTKDTDYTVEYSDNINVGTATVTITGKGSYEGAAPKTFSIVAKGIADGTVIDPVADQTYTGSAIEPSITIKDGKAELVEGTDYTLSYSNNTTPGTAHVNIAGKGNYTGVHNTTFTIKAAKMTSAKIVAKDQAYTGSAVTTTVTVTFGDKELTENTDYEITKYYNNTEVGLATVIVKGMGNFEGEAAAYFNITDGSTVTMHRVYNPNSGEHFYTASASERDGLVELGWQDEGTGWYAPATSATPVYRVYNPNAGDHHYTTSADERDGLVKAGWNDEGTGWYSDDAETVPVLRQYNPNAKTGAHNFTTSQTENDTLVSLGWQAEGTGWYALKAA